MISIPHTFLKDDYIQNPIIKRFCDDHELEVFETRVELIKAFERYASEDESKYSESLKWVLGVLKEGSKEFCYRKVYDISPTLKNPVLLKEFMQKLFPDCPFKNLIDYKNTHYSTLIDYEIKVNEQNEVIVLSMTFSQLVLEGYERNKTGEETIYPVFIDIYFDAGFVVSRAKAKSTIYEWTESELLTNDNHIETKKLMCGLINDILEKFELKSEYNVKKVRNTVSQMLYTLYNKYSFTPEDVVSKIHSVRDIYESFTEKIFTNLDLAYDNLTNAIQDIEIFVEKYISINGNNEDIFKKDRDAYLVKVVSDDAQDMTKIDTTSAKVKPLQCTEAFFDSKKTIIKNKKCDKLHLCFKREKSKYFGNSPFCVQFGAVQNCGFLKTGQYAEEGDIRNVLQTIFENY